jgi:hypothetical protein
VLKKQIFPITAAGPSRNFTVFRLPEYPHSIPGLYWFHNIPSRKIFNADSKPAQIQRGPAQANLQLDPLLHVIPSHHFCAIMPKLLQCRTFEWIACRKPMVSAGLPGATVKYNVAAFYGYLEYH